MTLSNCPAPTAEAGVNELPNQLVKAIVGLAKLSHVKSFSLPFKDFTLWRGLIAAQIRRATEAHEWPYLAMPLIATGGPIPGIHDSLCRKDLEWGGEIRIASDDTTCPADVFSWPGGGGPDLEHAEKAATLSAAVFDPWHKKRHSYCKYFLTRSTNMGAITGTTKTTLGDWVLYST